MRFLSSYSFNYSFADVTIAVGFGARGYALTLLRYPMLPILLGVILGPILEQGIRRSLITSGGDMGSFVSSPIAVVTLGLAAALSLYSFGKPFLTKRKAEQYEIGRASWRERVCQYV